MATVGQMDPDEELGDRDGCDGDFVIVGDEVFER